MPPEWAKVDVPAQHVPQKDEKRQETELYYVPPKKSKPGDATQEGTLVEVPKEPVVTEKTNEAKSLAKVKKTKAEIKADARAKKAAAAEAAKNRWEVSKNLFDTRIQSSTRFYCGLGQGATGICVPLQKC